MRFRVRLPQAVVDQIAAFDDLLYDVRPRVTGFLHHAMVVIGLLASVVLIAEYGFYLPSTWKSVVHALNVIIVWGFIANSLVGVVIAANRVEHAKERWFELVLTGLLLLGYIATLPLVGAELARKLVGFVAGTLEVEPARITSVYIALTQLYIFLNLLVGGARYSHRLLERRFRPVSAVVISFVGIIVVGSLLLMLPAASVTAGAMPALDAVFTSASAVCVTGLIVVDTATFFTMFGQTVILVLIQVGGLGLMTLTMFFVIFMEASASLRQQAYMRDVLNDATVDSARKTLESIIVFTLVIEAIGAVVLYISTPAELIIDRPRWFYSLFHSVSAFCNAGFSLWTPNLAAPLSAFHLPTNLMVMALIVSGGLGFTVLSEIVNAARSVARRRRPRFSVQARMVFAITAVLIIAGTVGYFFLERDATLSGLSPGRRLLASAFQSVTTRTAGFNTLDTTAIVVPTALMMIALMGIGGSPGGTAGGVKTTTVGIGFLSALATARGKRRIELLGRCIPEDTVNRAMTVLIFGASVVFMSAFVLSITEPEQDLVKLVFEEVSAFGTVGLSMGITAGLSAVGKVVIILSMFLGRVGPLTIAIALSQRVHAGKFEHPDEEVMVM